MGFRVNECRAVNRVDLNRIELGHRTKRIRERSMHARKSAGLEGENMDRDTFQLPEFIYSLELATLYVSPAVLHT